MAVIVVADEKQQQKDLPAAKSYDGNNCLARVRSPITQQQLDEYQHNFDSDPKAQLAALSIKNASYATALENREVYSTVLAVFSHSIQTKVNITDQKQSGRCWIFAGLNMLRQSLMKAQNIDEFEFSQSYLFFYDKLERANWFLENILDTLDEDLDGRVVQYLLHDPISDGGQWDMFVSLVEKYGLMPKAAYPETLHSSSSRNMDWLLTVKLREYAHRLRSKHAAGVPLSTLHSVRTGMLDEIHRILTISLGKPPTKFDWVFEDKDGKYKEFLDMTPQRFYKEVVGVDLTNTVSLINDPRNAYYKQYTVKYLGNIVGGIPVHYVNLPIERVKDLVTKVIVDKRPVWFGCDVGKFINASKGILDLQAVDYKAGFDVEFGLSKADRLRYGESMMTHAMLFTGVHLRGDERLRWRVENSWGPTYGVQGYLVMSEGWFDEYVYQVILEKKDLPDDVLE
ncbi:bleomycin hydrolase, partial [Spiromyces aspiralis]